VNKIKPAVYTARKNFQIGEVQYRKMCTSKCYFASKKNIFSSAEVFHIFLFNLCHSNLLTVYTVHCVSTEGIKNMKKDRLSLLPSV
jgi:hypothetical protein